MPTESRLLPFVAIVLLGMFCGGVYASRNFARNFEEFVWGITSFLMLDVTLGSVFYMRYLLDNGLMLSTFELILYIFLLLLPLTMTIGFSTYEILFSIKIKKPLLFHAKRFAGRMVATATYFLLATMIFTAIYMLLPPLVSENHIFTILIFSNLIAIIPTYYIWVKNPKLTKSLIGSGGSPQQ